MSNLSRQGAAGRAWSSAPLLFTALQARGGCLVAFSTARARSEPSPGRFLERWQGVPPAPYGEPCYSAIDEPAPGPARLPYDEVAVLVVSVECGARRAALVVGSVPRNELSVGIDG
jgi:hypothetical protein